MPAPLNLPLARAALSRNGDLRRNPNLLAELSTDPSTRAAVLFDGKFLAEPDQSALRLLPISELFDAADVHPLVYLGETTSDLQGLSAGSAIFLVLVDQAQANLLIDQSAANGCTWLQLRRSGFGLSDLDAGIATQALAISNWHATHSYCPNCGQVTEVVQAGWARHCSTCDRDVFPRTDPAVIAAVTDDEERLLLGSQGIWEANRWSVLAGFVDAGEALPAAVAREMFEESGLTVSEIEFQGSQPWPFPFSLMMAYTARAKGEQQLRPDGFEIEKLRWVSREQLAAEVHDLRLPSKASIARALIEQWYGAELVSLTETEEVQ
jgi:NAD+ diphosphatase